VLEVLLPQAAAVKKVRDRGRMCRRRAQGREERRKQTLKASDKRRLRSPLPLSPSTAPCVSQNIERTLARAARTGTLAADIVEPGTRRARRPNPNYDVDAVYEGLGLSGGGGGRR
jgi:hypothetical protein